MNNSNFSNFTMYFTKDQWFEMYGSTFLRGAVILFGITPVSLIGFLFNLISFVVFCRKKFQSMPLYSYLRLNTLASGMINFVTIFLFITSSHKFFDVFDNSSIPSIYTCYVYNPMMSICLYLSSALDICITLDRNSILSPKFNWFKIIKPIYLCLILVLVSIILTIDLFFFQYPTTVELKTSATSSFKMFTLAITDFSKSFLGSFLTTATFAIRDVFFLILQIVLSIITIILFKKHFNLKKKLVSKPKTSWGNFVVKDEFDKAHKIVFNKTAHEKISTKDRKLTTMVTVLVMLTSIQHILSIASFLSYTIFKSSYFYIIALVGGLVVSLKHFSNLIVYFSFNKLFRNEFKRFLNKN